MPRTRLPLVGGLSLLGLAMATTGCTTLSASHATPVAKASPSSFVVRPPAVQTSPSSVVRAAQLQSVDDLTGQQRWRTVLPMASVSTPLVAHGLVVVGGTNDCAGKSLTVMALSADTGRPVWHVTVQTTFPCGYSRPLALAGSVVVAGGNLGISSDPHDACPSARTRRRVAPVIGLDLATGHLRWKAPAAANVVISTTADVVFSRPEGSGCLIALDARSGQVRWSVRPKVSPLEIVTGPAGTFLAGQLTNGSMQLLRLNPSTGAAGWITALPYFTSIGSSAVTRTVTVQLTAEPGLPLPPSPGAPSDSPVTSFPVEQASVAGYNAATGRQLWQVAGQVGDLLFSSSSAVLTGHQGIDLTIQALNPQTGHRLWLSPRIAHGQGPLAAGDSSVLVYTAGHLLALNATNGRSRWSIPEPAYVLATTSGKSDYVAAYGSPKNRPGGS